MKRRKLIKNPRKARIRDALDGIALSYDNFSDFNTEYWENCRKGTYWLAVKNRFFNIGPAERKDAREGRFVLSCNPNAALKRKPDAEFIIQYSSHPELEIKKVSGNAGHVKILNVDLLTKVRTMTIKKAKDAYLYQSRYLPSSEDELYDIWKAAHDSYEEGLKRKTARGKKKAKK